MTGAVGAWVSAGGGAEVTVVTVTLADVLPALFEAVSL
jgi:hypothetical protein